MNQQRNNKYNRHKYNRVINITRTEIGSFRLELRMIISENQKAIIKYREGLYIFFNNHLSFEQKTAQSFKHS